MNEYSFGCDSQEGCDIVDNVFHDENRLRGSKATHGRVARQVGPADVTDRAKVRNIVTVVTTTQGTVHHLQQVSK